MNLLTRISMIVTNTRRAVTVSVIQLCGELYRKAAKYRHELSHMTCRKYSLVSGASLICTIDDTFGTVQAETALLAAVMAPTLVLVVVIVVAARDGPSSFGCSVRQEN